MFDAGARFLGEHGDLFVVVPVEPCCDASGSSSQSGPSVRTLPGPSCVDEYGRGSP